MSEIIPIIVPMTVEATETTIPMGFDVAVNVWDADPYDGAYEWTPNTETQIIQIRHKMARDNIVINPIPSNYGRIDWNGAVLTVS